MQKALQCTRTKTMILHVHIFGLCPVVTLSLFFSKRIDASRRITDAPFVEKLIIIVQWRNVWIHPRNSYLQRERNTRFNVWKGFLENCLLESFRFEIIWAHKCRSKGFWNGQGTFSGEILTCAEHVFVAQPLERLNRSLLNILKVPKIQNFSLWVRHARNIFHNFYSLEKSSLYLFKVLSVRAISCLFNDTRFHRTELYEISSLSGNKYSKSTVLHILGIRIFVRSPRVDYVYTKTLRWIAIF